MTHRSPFRRTALGVLVGVVALSAGPGAQVQNRPPVWIDALCGSDPVGKHLHERLDKLATDRQWQGVKIPGGCEWLGDKPTAAQRDDKLNENAKLIVAAMPRASSDRAVVVLANSMVAARIARLAPDLPPPTVLNPRLVAREVYLFSTDPTVLCGKATRLRVGYLRNTARRAEIVATLAFENGERPRSAIEATEVDSVDDFVGLLGETDPSRKGLDVAALVADDAGGSYSLFKKQVIDQRNGAVQPVKLCKPGETQSPATWQPSLDGSVSFLKLVAAPDSTVSPGAPVLALVRPGQEPAVAAPKGWLAWFADALVPTGHAADARIRHSVFQDFPVLFAIGPGERTLAADPELKQILSDCYFEGMFDSLAGGLNPCQERSDMLFGVYLLNAYLEDNGRAYKGCALQAYYELMSTTNRRPETARKNVEIMMLKPALASCLTSGPPPPPKPPVDPAAQSVSCTPDPKERFEADYGKHYPYYREGLRAIAAALNTSGPAKEQSLRLAENCLTQAITISEKAKEKRSCAKFSQGLFVVPYEPSLPLGMIKLKGGS